ncbi:MAG: SPOR domain-containing protein [Maricaulaceae bacterium]
MTSQDDDIRPTGYDGEIHQPFDVQAHHGQYAMWKLIGALAFLVILALIVFYAYQTGARDRGDPIVISPTKTALKIPPPKDIVEPQGNNAIYSAGSNNNPSETITAIEPENPITLPKAVTVIETTPPPVKAPTETQAPVKQVTATVPAPTTSKPQPPNSGGVTNVPGKYLVQVASLKSYEEAEATWNRLSKKHNFLRGQLYDIKRVDLGDKGIYYRLRIDGLSSREYAATVCNKLKANGQACFQTGR